MKARTIKAYFDGACTLNPTGNCACGVVITDGDETLLEQGYFLGKAGGSNTAEYQGLIRVLEFLRPYNKSQIEIMGDSKLIIMQMRK